MEQGEAQNKGFRNNLPFTSRIKKMMQADEDVGKVAKASPVLICTWSSSGGTLAGKTAWLQGDG